MSRCLIAIAVVAGVMLAGTAQAGPTAAPASRSAAKAAPKATKKVAKTTKSRRAKLAKAGKSRRAKLARAKHSNMPRGFTWPPSQEMRAAGAACERALDDAGVAWKPTGREGHIVAAITLDDGTLGGIRYSSVYRKGPHKLDCQLALALANLGPALESAGVREVRFGSIYRWTKVRVNGRTKNTLSRHALGLAMDVVSFVDADGREANVARDYPSGDPLLLAVEDAINASGAFRLVLTPKNDPLSHDDHFHIEANPSYAKPVPRS